MKRRVCGKCHVRHGHWLLCIIQRPSGRRKCVWEMGEAGMKLKKLRAVIVNVEKSSVSRSSFELDICWQNVKRKGKKKKLGMKGRREMFQRENNAVALSALHPMIHEVTWKIHDVCSNCW